MRCIMVGDVLSNCLNVPLLPRHKYTNDKESISGGAYRCKWKYTEIFINTVCYPFEKDHCRKAFESDLKSAKMLVEKYENIN